MENTDKRPIEEINIKKDDIVEANIRFQIFEIDGPYLECIFYDDDHNMHSCKLKEKKLTRIRRKDFLCAIQP